MTKPVIGFVGLGKLGLPLAVSIASRGYKILGYDVNPELMKKRVYEHRECGPDGFTYNFQDYFDKADLNFHNLPEVMAQADLVFVIVQTPHGPEYEGSTRLPTTRADFNYKYLIEACAEVAKHKRPDQIIAVVSTVLPGTMRKHILPLLPDAVYNPAFPAMGTAMRDYLYPEFVLMGSDNHQALTKLADFFRSLLFGIDSTLPTYGWTPDIHKVSIESAELTKVTYNTWITAKTILANNAMEIAHKIPGCDVDEVTTVLASATRRLISSAYMAGGVADGGGCHPRDNIAMSWLAEQLKLSCNLYDNLMMSREWQAEWLVDLLCSHGKGMQKIILGKAYKAESAITTGSGAVLMANILKERGYEFTQWDPYVDGEINSVWARSAAYLVATKHEAFKGARFPHGSVVIDPFRYLPEQSGVAIVRVGKGM